MTTLLNVLITTSAEIAHGIKAITSVDQRICKTDAEVAKFISSFCSGLNEQKLFSDLYELKQSYDNINNSQVYSDVQFEQIIDFNRSSDAWKYCIKITKVEV